MYILQHNITTVSYELGLLNLSGHLIDEIVE